MKACRLFWVRSARFCAVIALTVSLAACAFSQITSSFRSNSKTETSAPGVSEERLLEAAKGDTGQADLVAMASNCPSFSIRPQGKTLTIYEIGRVGDSLAIRLRGEITKTARECQISTDHVIVKYGFAGRVLMGPRGTPGAITLPLQVQVADRSGNTISAQQVQVSVNMSPDNPVGYFSTVRELPINLPPGTRSGDYDLYLAFERTDPGAG